MSLHRGMSSASAHRSTRGAFVAVLAAAFAVAATAEAAPSNDECLVCHDGGADEKGFSASDWAASAHSLFACTDCHGDATEIPHADELAPVAIDTCANCHAAAIEEYERGVHGRRVDGEAAASCRDCHGGVHATRAHSDPESRVHWSQMAVACAECHTAGAATRRGLPLAQPVAAYLESVHGLSVAAGERAATCTDCHGSHEILPAIDSESTIAPMRVADTCGACHAEEAAQYRESVHGAALARRRRDAPTCTDCHGEHAILPHLNPAAPVFAANLATATCARCHADLRLTRRYGLSVEKVDTFRDSFHGLAMRAGQPGVANCASCHGVHDILPSSDPRSRIHESNLAATCGTCHPGAGSRFAIGAVHVLPASFSGRIEFWIRSIYLWVIALVVGGMFAHNAVDWIVKLRRGVRGSGAVDANGPIRMSRTLRAQHGLVMVSFPVLVYTGFALTYPESWWASPLLRWEANVALRGTLHRAAAIVILIALGWHALHWLANSGVRRHLRGLAWGWGDLRYLGARLAWYAGWRRHLPPSGSFSYIEKAEYWAFLWGMVIMTVSGVPLWFNDFMLRNFPKWWMDVATAIHFYEAVLATLAIVVWHFYWVIFDPEVYPMDTTWWSGRSPQSRVHERDGAPKPIAPGSNADGEGDER